MPTEQRIFLSKHSDSIFIWYLVFILMKSTEQSQDKDLVLSKHFLQFVKLSTKFAFKHMLQIIVKTWSLAKL